MKETDKNARKVRKPLARRIARLLLFSTLTLVVALMAFVVSIPYILTRVSIPELEFDLSPYLTGKAGELVERKSATAVVKVNRGDPDGFRIRATGRLLDWPYTATANIRVGFVRAEGNFTLSIDNTDWRLDANFEAKSTIDWRFNTSVAERTLSETDPVLAALLGKIELDSVSNLVFSSVFSLDAEGECSKDRPVPSWKVRGMIKDADLSFDMSPENRFEVKRLRTMFGAAGIADHMDISPLFPRADSVSIAGIALSNVFASVHATERSYLVTEAGADCCGGALRLYSLFLDPERLSVGATIFVDGINAGEVLSHVPGFHGEATGSLHGKIPFFLKNGRELHLKNSYLFSKPGETGVMRISDATPILDNLALTGIATEDRANLSDALANLDYKVLKMELLQDEKADGFALALQLDGTATRGTTTVPVRLDVTFRGDLDQLLNTGMNISRSSL